MKKIIITFVIAILSITAMAQDRKVAVFDPAGSVDKSLKEIVREEISSIIVNTGGFTVLERQLIDKVLEENRFQSGGLVDDSQISEIGKRMGANMVFVSSIMTMSGAGGDNYYVSCKMIDVQTARIEKQKTGQTQRGSSELISVVQKIVSEMFGTTVTTFENTSAISSGVTDNNSSNNNFILPSKYTQGKEITFVSGRFTPILYGLCRGEIIVYFDEDIIWTGGIEGFIIKIKDPKPGPRIFRVVVKAYQKDKRGNESEIAMKKSTGGTFNINTQEKDYYEFTVNMGNSVKLKK